MSGDFEGLVAIVTGGASGIGAAIAAKLAAAGARVAVLDVNIDGVPDTMLAVRTDVADDTSVRSAVGEVAAQLGGIDIVINNAGIGAAGTIADHTDDEWRRVFEINVFGLVRVTRAALPWLLESTAASVVNTASVAATAGLPQRAIYSASKGAVVALTKAMAADHLADGIRVNCINPGTADTPWVQRLLAAADDPVADRAAREARQPHGRLISADEVAGGVLYLASPLSGSTTGTSLSVDGGMQDLRLRPRTPPAS